MNGLQLSIPRRLILIRLTIVVTLSAMLLCNPMLWCGEHLFPKVPVIEAFSLSHGAEVTFVCLSVILLLSSTILRFHRLLLAVAILLLTALVMADVNRLQPWYYTLLGLLVIFPFYNGRVDDPNRYTSYFIMVQLVFSSFYFYSGLSQLNCRYINEAFPMLAAPLHAYVSDRQFHLLCKLAYASPYLFMFAGIGLNVPAIRYLAVTVAVVVHASVLCLRPTWSIPGLWMSNISFMLLLVLLFSGRTKQRYFSPTILFQRWLFYPLLVIFLVMPALNNSGRLPDNFSGNNRTGNELSAVIAVRPEAFLGMPQRLKPYFRPENGKLVFDYNRWSKDEIHVPVFPDASVFKAINDDVRMRSSVKETELVIRPHAPLLCNQ